MRRTIGPDAAPTNLFTDGDPATSTPATVVGSDFLNIVQEELCNLITAAGLSIDQAHGFSDSTPNNTSQLLAAVLVLAGSGGGGGGFKWTPVDGEAPSESFEFGDLVYLFDAGITQTVQAYLKIPQGYQSGKQISIYLAFYSSAATGTVLFQSVATLIRKNQDAINSLTNQYTSTNAAITNAVANQYRQTLLDLTDTTGKVNSVAVSPGDLLMVQVSRATDLDVTQVRLVPNATEPKFG